MKKRLLLADDSVTIQKVVQITFSHDDYELTVVDNGDTAYEKARLQPPDLILADVFMPGKNGYELCSAVKKDPALATVPVLLLTGTFEPFDEAKAKSAGADRWIAKPFESQALIACVEELLKEALQAPPPAPQISLPPLNQVVMNSGTPASPSAQAVELADDMWGSDFVVESDFGSGEPSSDPFAPASPDDLWDVDGFDADVSGGTATSEDIWGVDFDEPVPASPSPVPLSAVAGGDSWGGTDVSPEFSAKRETSSVDLSSNVTEIPLVDEVEILEEIDFLEPFEEPSSDDSFASVELSSAEGIAVAGEPAYTNLAPETTSPIVETPLPAVGGVLDDSQLDLIVERVAEIVVSRLAGTLLEKIAWEVVPDLAETMIKEELRKIREIVDAD